MQIVQCRRFLRFLPAVGKRRGYICPAVAEIRAFLHDYIAFAVSCGIGAKKRSVVSKHEIGVTEIFAGIGYRRFIIVGKSIYGNFYEIERVVLRAEIYGCQNYCRDDDREKRYGDQNSFLLFCKRHDISSLIEYNR